MQSTRLKGARFGSRRPSTDKPWHYVINGARKGPFTSATIDGLFAKKEIESDAQVRRKGMSEWKSANACASMPGIKFQGVR